MRKALMIIMVLAGFIMHLSAQDFQSGDLLYTIIGVEPPQVRLDGHINGTTAQGTLDIPPTVTHEGLTYAVIEIGEDAFYLSHNLIGDLVIPDGVTTIGNRAFDACSGFTGNLVLPSSVTSIGSFAFSECNFTGNLNIPNSVTDLGRNAFFECPSFTGDLVIPESLHKIPYGAFMSCTSLNGNLFLPESIDTIEARALCHCGFTGTLILPNNCRYIGPNAFEYCTGFTGELAIPEGTEIDYQAFIGCSGFTSLSLPNSITTIEGGVFRYCSGLSGQLSLPTSLTTLGSCAFEGCQRFTGPLIIPDGVTVIEGGCFCDCTGFTGALALPNSLTHIYGCAFKNCSGFTQVTFPSSLIFIGGEPDFAGGGAFENCNGLEGSLELPDSLCFIGERAFFGCSNLTGPLTIPTSVNNISHNAFEGCVGLESVDITNRDAEVSIGRRAFRGCTNLHEIVFHENVVEIGSNAFLGTGWEDDQPDGVLLLHDWYLGYKGDASNTSNVFLEMVETTRGVADRAFAGRTNIKSLNIPLDCPMVTVGDSAFYGCNCIESQLVLPETVETIGQSAFENCTKLHGKLVFGNSLRIIDTKAFKNCNKLEQELVIPDMVTRIGSSAFMGCQHLTSISIGKSVDQIFTEAFSGCTNVNTLYFNATNCTEIVNYYQTAFWLYNCPISTLVFGDEVLSIPANAFYYLSNVLETIRSWAETPPTVMQNAFHGIDHDVLLKVPCGSAESYQSDPQWGVFNNIIEEYYELTVSADDPNHGTCCILKQGDCDDAESIVQAIPAQNHIFTYWTNNSEVVSYDETYTFNLQTTTHLVAHFDYDGLLEECENGISIYPNPAKDIIYIEGAKVVEASIFNTFGQLIKTFKNTNGIGADDLSHGVYLMRIITADESLHTTRLIVE